MPTLVKVRKWGNSLGVRLPKSFTSERAIADGAMLAIDDLRVIDTTQRRRSSYKLPNLLKHYQRPPKTLDFPPSGKELA